MTMNKQLALMDKRSEQFVPTLMQAIQLNTDIEAQKDKQHDLLLKAYSEIDIKKSEVQILKQARSYTRTKEEKIKGEDGRIQIVNKIVDSRNINFLIKKLGRPEVTGIIRILLVNLNDKFNFNKEKLLSKYQIKELAEDIIDLHGERLYLDELLYIFKSSKQKKLYSSLNMKDVLDWIDEYRLNTLNTFHKQHLNNKNSDATITVASDLAKKFTIPISDTDSSKKTGTQKMVERYRIRDQNNAGIDTTKVKVIGYKKDKKKKE